MSTLKDVAKECGLSVTTVSRALNNRGYISSEAHEKIQAAMKKLNYQPNEIARSLSKQSSKSIGVIALYRSAVFSRLLNYLELEADKRAIFLCILFQSICCQGGISEICKRHRVAGIILCTDAVNIDKFASVSVPIISLGGKSPMLRKALSVTMKQERKNGSGTSLQAGLPEASVFKPGSLDRDAE